MVNIKIWYKLRDAIIMPIYSFINQFCGYNDKVLLLLFAVILRNNEVWFISTLIADISYKLNVSNF